MEKKELLNPELLRINAPNGGFYIGGAQQWFEDSWKRMSGCGPTTASGILWYLARSRQNSALCCTDKADRAGFLNFMNTVFGYVTPGIMGVNSTAAFVDGVESYGISRGVKTQTCSLKIPQWPQKRPKREALCDFILESLGTDSPVAFLNLSNGLLKNLSSWHWVMIIALDPDYMMATICDYGGTKEISLDEWLKSTFLGGGFVSVSL